MVNRTARTGQSGSSSAFLLIGAVLVILAIGGIYVLRGHGGSESAPSKPVAVNKSPSTAPSTQVKPHSSSTKKSSAPSKSKTPRSVADNSRQKALPATGPSDNLSEAIILAVISGFVVSYVQSRRARVGLVRS